MTDDLSLLTATALVAGYRDRSLDPVAVAEAVLDKADAAQTAFNCFYRILRDSALAEARASAARWAAGEPAGVLDGVPVTIKENVAVRGVPRPSGTAAKWDAPEETEDGPITARVRECGGVVTGVTVMPDWGMLSSGVSSLHGITRSPWNPAWTVGGSSGGAGAAGAARVGPLHSGSDIGGSLRLPATWLGLVTLKPSFGRVPVDPPYMGRVAGPIARTVPDAALFLSVISQPDARDHMSLPYGELDWPSASAPGAEEAMQGKHIAVHVDGGAGIATDPAVAAAVRAVAELAAEQGAIVDEIEAPMTEELLADLDLFLRARSLLDYRSLSPERQTRVLPFIREWVEGAAGTTNLDVVTGYNGIMELRRRTIAMTLPYDAVLSPVAPVAAFHAEWPMPSNDPTRAMHHIAYTAPYNFSDQPASSINCGFTVDGRPIGVQIAGPRFADVDVLRLTSWYETVRPATAQPAWPDWAA